AQSSWPGTTESQETKSADQAVGYTAWHADTGRERLQQGFDVIMCYVRPHLRLRLGAAAVGPILVGLIWAAAGIEPASLVALYGVKSAPNVLRIKTVKRATGCQGCPAFPPLD
uniref:Uncharacterized protein n=1 Tax=Oryzias latipes TaxID=8090 RepID=A0A3B3HF49_ORYLA